MKNNTKSVVLLSILLSIAISCCSGVSSSSTQSNESLIASHSPSEASIYSGTKPSDIFNDSSLALTPSPTNEMSSWKLTDLSITSTYAVLPTVINPTPIPIDTKDEFLLDIQSKGYSLYYGSSTEGPGGFSYSALIFLDNTFSPYPNRDDISAFPPYSFRSGPETNGCIIAFYRSDGNHNELIRTFDAPLYTPGSYYDGFPVHCIPNDWNQPMNYSYHYPPESEIYDLLGLDGVWSDINQNGLPEFSVHYQYCPNACLDAGAVSTHIYEIQTTSRVTDITADLPGVIEPFNLIHSVDPITFYVYDPTLWYCYKWCIIDTWWIYQWDGDKLVDVTANYIDEYMEIGEEIKANVELDYGRLFREWTLLSILFHYQKAGLNDLALDTFLDITDLGYWPEASDLELCWLQYARAKAQIDSEEGRQYEFPEFRLIDEPVDPVEFLSRIVPDWVQSGYDLSACEYYLEAQTTLE
jgi:hypothetical protein